jgi:Sigma-70 region 2
MDSRPSDEMLLLAVAERDMGAFRTLYEHHAGWLAIRLARRCNDRDLVADAIQDTFVAVWQRPRGFRDDGDITAWLWGIAIRRLVSRLRTRGGVAAVRIRRGVRGPDADRGTGCGGRHRRRAGADGAQPRAAGRAVCPHVPVARRQRAVLRITCNGSSSRCAWWPSPSRSVAEICPGADGLEASRTPTCLGRPVRSVDDTCPD